MGKEQPEPEYIRDQYGDIVREKKTVPLLPCLKLVLDHVPPEELQYCDLDKALSATKGAFINDHLTKEIVSLYLIKYVLPKVANEYPELQQTLILREGVAFNDFERAYYAGGEYPENFDRALYLAELAADITMSNNHISIERRKEILKRFEEVALSPNKAKEI